MRSFDELKNKILVLDDDPATLEMVCTFLESKGFEVLRAESCEAGNRIWDMQRPDAAVLDYALPDGNSLELLARWKLADPNVPVIVLTGYASIDIAVRAIKLGAEQFLTKPLDLASLYLLLQRTLENQLVRVKHDMERARQQCYRIDPFLGNSPAVHRLFEIAHKLLATDSPVLIVGETGTGKGVLAHWIHDNGSRAKGPFVDLNCSGLSRELLESELFGHKKGAFTGAVNSKVGLLEMAHRGTVFLDEIGDMDLQIQPRFLKVLEENRFRPVGDIRERVVNLRVIAATHNDLTKGVHLNRFRSDLYFRISAIPLFTPPLRERVQDIPLLAEWILNHLVPGFGKRSYQVTTAALKALESYPWPGNIRELRNVLERAVLLSEGQPIAAEHLHFIDHVSIVPKSAQHARTLEQVERDYIEEILIREEWRIKDASRVLEIPLSSLYEKIKRFGLSRPSFGAAKHWDATQEPASG